jgi:ubiquinol-cytochrome c reductase iron-sulfur subunit
MNDQVDSGRRRLLTAATVGTGAIGVAFAAVPFLASWLPSERAKAMGAPVTVDASQLEIGQSMKVVWRGQPVYIVRRPKAALEQIKNHDRLLADPNSDDSVQPAYIKNTHAVRAINAEFWVGLAVCTHLGCSPLGAFQPDNQTQLTGIDLGAQWPGGFYCPCHGSKFDISGRVFKSMPAPRNLTVPPYTFAGNGIITIGVDPQAKA